MLEALRERLREHARHLDLGLRAPRLDVVRVVAEAEHEVGEAVGAPLRRTARGERGLGAALGEAARAEVAPRSPGRRHAVPDDRPGLVEHEAGRPALPDPDAQLGFLAAERALLHPSEAVTEATDLPKDVLPERH